MRRCIDVRARSSLGMIVPASRVPDPLQIPRAESDPGRRRRPDGGCRAQTLVGDRESGLECQMSDSGGEKQVDDSSWEVGGLTGEPTTGRPPCDPLRRVVHGH
jgi:hypothetical protein